MSASAGPLKTVRAASRPLGPAAIAVLVLLCASWGGQQVAAKYALAAFPPFLQMGLRSAGAGLLLLVYCMARGKGRLRERDGSLWPGLLAGALFSGEFVCVYVGLQWTDASRASLFLYTAPFFVALGAAWLLPDERMGWRQWLGLAFSFGGVAVVLGVPHAAASRHALLGDLVILGGGMLWAATTLVIKVSRLRLAAPEKVLLYQLGVSAAAGLLGAALAGERPGAMTAPALWSLAYQTVWVVAFTYVLWFRLLAVYPASSLQASTSMTPLFGVASAALIMGDPVEPAFALAAVLVVLGLLLVNRKPRP